MRLKSSFKRNSKGNELVEEEGDFGTSSKRVWRDEMVACEGVCLIVRALMVMMIACLIVSVYCPTDPWLAIMRYYCRTKMR